MYNCLFINEVNSLGMLASYEGVEIKWSGDKITLWNFGNLAVKWRKIHGLNDGGQNYFLS